MHFLTDARMKVVARQLLQACGYGRYLLVGDVDQRLVRELRRQCVLVDVRADWLEDASSMRDAGGGADGHDVVFLAIAKPDIPLAQGVVKEALRCAHNAVCIFAAAQEPIRTEFAQVEKEFIHSGARRHPGITVLAPLGGHQDAPSAERWWLFEKVPPEAVRAYPAKIKGKGWAGYGDPTRAVDRSAREYLARYASIGAFVRPGDRILDAACGVGAGPRWLASLTRASRISGMVADAWSKEYAEASFANGIGIPVEFDTGNPSDMSLIGDGTVDFCLGMDAAVAPVLKPYLAAAHRVLTAGGRLCVGVPIGMADGVDPEGKFTRDSLTDPCVEIVSAIEGAGFLMEQCWFQDSDGNACSPSEHDPESGLPEGWRGWCLVLAMKPPATGRMHAASEPLLVPNILSFERDYAFPALVKSMVSMGLRTTSPTLLEWLTDDTLQRVPFDSADAGAALCVKLYLRLESGAIDARGDDDLLAQVSRYIDGKEVSPTGFRWRVSLAYASGLYWQLKGVPERSKEMLAKVAGFDAARFSPLLGTKTVGAAVLLGQIAHAESDSSTAEIWWRRALSEVCRIVDGLDWSEVLGDEQAPETFGMPELALVMLQGARAAAGLRAMSEGIRVGHQGLWRMLDASLDGQLQARAIEVDILRESIRQLEQKVEWLESGSEKGGRWIARLEQARDWLQAHADSLEVECDRRGASIDDLLRQQRELGSSKGWLESQVDSLTAECDRRGTSIDDLLSQQRELESSKGRLESQVESLTAECDRRAASIGDLLGQQRELESSKGWLESQVESLTAECDRRAASIGDLLDQQQGLESSKGWLESQVNSLTAECDRQAGLVNDLNGKLVTLQWLEEQVSSWRNEAKRLDIGLTAVQASLDEAVKEIAAVQHDRVEMETWLQGQVASWMDEAKKQALSLAACEAELARERLERERLRVEMEEIVKQKESMDNTGWVRLGMRLGLLGRPGDNE